MYPGLVGEELFCRGRYLLLLSVEFVLLLSVGCTLLVSLSVLLKMKTLSQNLLSLDGIGVLGNPLYRLVRCDLLLSLLCGLLRLCRFLLLAGLSQVSS